jgi:uncharacterized membrane protein YgdD (TMEM256/DUF423 family)
MKKKHNYNKLGLLIGLVGVLAVILGAFGAHSLKATLPPDRLITYNTGITYHFYHLIAMVFAWISLVDDSSRWARRAFWCFLIGIICFSGSIYLLATRDLLGLVHYRWLGPITPIGGVFFILGWSFLGLSFYHRSLN